MIITATMESLFRLLNVSPRPLLYASGAVALVAGIYHYYICNDEEERTVNTTNTPVSADAGQMISADVPSVDSSSVSDVDEADEVNVTPTDAAVPEDSLSETEELTVSSVPVDTETSDQEDSRSELGNQEDFCEAPSEWEGENQVCPDEAMKNKCISMVHTIKPLEENIKQVQQVQEVVDELSSLLCEVQAKRTNVKKTYGAQLKLRSYIKAEYLTMEEHYHKTISALQVSLAEAKKKMQSSVDLNNENSCLKSDQIALENSIRKLKTEIRDTERKCDEMSKECEEMNQKLSNLQSEYNEMMRISLEEKPDLYRMLMLQNSELRLMINQKEDLIKLSKKKQEECVETNKKLEIKKVDLLSQKNSLLESTTELRAQLLNTHKTCDEMIKDRDQAREAQSIQEMQCRTMSNALKHCTKALNERKGAERKTQHVELSSNEEFLKAALATANRKYEQKKEYNDNLEKENLALMSKSIKLVDKVKNLEDLYSEMYKKYVEADKECVKSKASVQHTEDHYKKRLKNLLDTKSSREISLQEYTDLITEEKSTHGTLRQEISSLTLDFRQNDNTVTELENVISQTETRCINLTAENEEKGRRLSDLDAKWKNLNETLLKDHDEEITAHHTLQLQYNRIKEQHDALLKMYVKKQEDYSMLKSEYDQMKETLLNNKESQSVSCAEAEDKCEPVMESSVQLGNRKSDLMAKVNTLRSSVQQIKEELSQTQEKCEELTRERDQEREAHRILQSEYSQMKAECSEMMEIIKQCHEQLKPVTCEPPL